MRVPCLVAVFSALSIAVVVPSAAGQSGKWTAPRTPDGKPDLQGTFTFSTITPLQRPAALNSKDVLTPEEAAAFEASENKRLNRDLVEASIVAADRAAALAGGRRVVRVRARVSGRHLGRPQNVLTMPGGSKIAPEETHSMQHSSHLGTKSGAVVSLLLALLAFPLDAGWRQGGGQHRPPPSKPS
jgi:hypothetical protein